MTYEEKKECVFQNYERSWDLSIAIRLVELSDSEKKKY